MWRLVEGNDHFHHDECRRCEQERRGMAERMVEANGVELCTESFGLSTSPATAGDRELPPPTLELARFVAEVDWSDAASVIEYLLEYVRALAEPERVSDEPAARTLVRSDVERARNYAASQNDQLVEKAQSDRPLSSIEVPTLVVHGTADR